MESPLTITIPRNEITIVALALVLCVIYNTQSGIGVWGSVSLTTVLAILVLGSIFLVRTSDTKTAITLLLVVFLFTVTGVMIAYNFIFFNKLPKELRDGYWIPTLTTSIFHGMILVMSLIAIILVSTNSLVINNTRMRYYENMFSIAITLVLLNAGLMAGA